MSVGTGALEQLTEVKKHTLNASISSNGPVMRYEYKGESKVSTSPPLSTSSLWMKCCPLYPVRSHDMSTTVDNNLRLWATINALSLGKVLCHNNEKTNKYRVARRWGLSLWLELRSGALVLRLIGTEKELSVTGTTKWGSTVISTEKWTVAVINLSRISLGV